MTFPLPSNEGRGTGGEERARFTGTYVYATVPNGRSLTRVPVSLNTAFATAGAIGGVPGSPTPVGSDSLGTMCTSTTGASLILSTRYVSKLCWSGAPSVRVILP